MKDKGTIQPPKLATRFFKWYCCKELRESILGDLYEQYLLKYDEKGAWKANWIYWINVITFINRHTLKRNNNTLIGNRLSGEIQT